jgi:hypothetical protein
VWREKKRHCVKKDTHTALNDTGFGFVVVVVVVVVVVAVRPCVPAVIPYVLFKNFNHYTDDDDDDDGYALV